MISKSVKYASFIALQSIHRKLPVDANKVLFFSDVRDELGGNLKFVCDALNEDKWEKATYCRDKQVHPQDFRDIRTISYELNTARCILLEDVLSFLEFYRPKPGQEIIQLWHACGAYKKFGFSRAENGLRVSKGHRKYTGAITSSEAIRGCYAEAYGISEDRVIATGIPRTDIFYEEAWKMRVKEQFLTEYPQTAGKKVILFAPTYRGTKIGDAGYDMDKLPMEYLRQELAKDFVFVTKWHPAMYNNLDKGSTDDDDFHIDVSHIRDVNDILPIADVLITDYSSVIFEWSLLDRPIVYYVHDEENYEQTRGLYCPFEEYVYGDVARNPAELVDALKQEHVDEAGRRHFINKFMNCCDGNATKRVARLIEGD